MNRTVQDLKTVLGFAWKYMRPYWTRLVAGIVLGCVCGLMASAFIWATRTLAERLETPKTTTAGVADEERDARKPKISLSPAWEARLQQWRQSVNTTIDPWLPRAGVELDWRR